MPTNGRRDLTGR